jgi:hypothetical protein
MWVELSHGQFVGGQIVKAPSLRPLSSLFPLLSLPGPLQTMDLNGAHKISTLALLYIRMLDNLSLAFLIYFPNDLSSSLWNTPPIFRLLSAVCYMVINRNHR